MRHGRLSTLFAMLMIAAGCMQQPIAASPIPTVERVLLVAPPTHLRAAGMLANAIADAGRPRPSVVGMNDYAPLVDVRAFDGFILLGADSDAPPKAGFVRDMRASNAPLLWVGHHVDLLGAATLAEMGLTLEGPPSQAYHVGSATRSERADVVRTVTVAKPAAPALKLRKAGFAGTAVGAARSGRLTYAAFIPDFAPGSESVAAFVRLVVERFGIPSPAPTAPTSFASRVAEARADDFATGVHLPVYVSETHGNLVGYDGDALHDNLVRIRDAGAEWVVIQRIFYQHGVGATEIFGDPQRTATLPSMANIVADAHKLGLKVRLVPVVNLTEESRRHGDWRGFIQPTDPDRWWARYREIVLEDAAFARDHGVEALDLGAELSALVAEENHWRTLATDVRNVVGYNGLVGYQVNFDMLTRLTWSDALDYLAVAAYWPLSEESHPEVENLMAAWQDIWDRIGPWIRARPELRVEFGEIGYVAQAYTSVLPFSWKPHKAGELDVTEQLICYLALEKFLADRPEIRGVSIFASTADDTDPTSIGYSPFAKPAAAVVRRILHR